MIEDHSLFSEWPHSAQADREQFDVRNRYMGPSARTGRCDPERARITAS